jgi:hypothetical protein
MKTTLKKIYKCNPCQRGWNTLLSSLGKTEEDDTIVDLLHILKKNRPMDALWALRAFTLKECQMFAIGVARLNYNLNDQLRFILDSAEAHVLGTTVNGVCPPVNLKQTSISSVTECPVAVDFAVSAALCTKMGTSVVVFATEAVLSQFEVGGYKDSAAEYIIAKASQYADYALKSS